MDQLTVPTCDLLALLRDVSAAASRDDHTPWVCGVLLHTAADDHGDTVLVASATDRYIALHGTTPVAGALPAPLWLANDQVAQILATIRPYSSRKRTLLAETAIAVQDGRVTFRQLALDNLAEMAVTVTHNTAAKAFPDIARVISEAAGRDDTTCDFHVDGARIGRFARIAAARGISLHIRATGPNKPVIVQTGRDLVGIAMPIRVGSEKAEPMPVAVYPLPVLESAA